MRKVIATLAILAGAVLMSPALQANFTLFDLAKDSMHIARGEFTGLERTIAGDRLTLRCDEIISGGLTPGGSVVLEAFESAPADDALGREVIVCFNEVDGDYFFVNHPHGQRSFIFETSDVAPDGLDRNEQALRNFLAINAPYDETIKGELRKRGELGDLSYMGEFEPQLREAWKSELLNQVAWTGTRAAKDAAKALVEHELFRGIVTVADLELVGVIVPDSAPGTIGRAYMLELIRNQDSAHPNLDTLMGMLREETSQACVGKLSNLFLAKSRENRELVLARIGEIATDTGALEQERVNALQVFEALKFTDGLPYVHQALVTEIGRTGNSKEVVRGALKALRSTPDDSNVDALKTCLESDYVKQSWELTQRTWVAFAMVDNDETNETLRVVWGVENDRVKRRFFQKLLPENKIVRELILIHRED